MPPVASRKASEDFFGASTTMVAHRAMTSAGDRSKRATFMSMSVHCPPPTTPIVDARFMPFSFNLAPGSMVGSVKNYSIPKLNQSSEATKKSPSPSDSTTKPQHTPVHQIVKKRKEPGSKSAVESPKKKDVTPKAPSNKIAPISFTEFQNKPKPTLVNIKTVNRVRQMDAIPKVVEAVAEKKSVDSEESVDEFFECEEVVVDSKIPPVGQTSPASSATVLSIPEYSSNIFVRNGSGEMPKVVCNMAESVRKATTGSALVKPIKMKFKRLPDEKNGSRMVCQKLSPDKQGEKKILPAPEKKETGVAVKTSEEVTIEKKDEGKILPALKIKEGGVSVATIFVPPDPKYTLTSSQRRVSQLPLVFTPDGQKRMVVTSIDKEVTPKKKPKLDDQLPVANQFDKMVDSSTRNQAAETVAKSDSGNQVLVAVPIDVSVNQAEVVVVNPVRPDNTAAAFAAHLEEHLYEGKPGPEIVSIKSRVLDLEGNRELWLVEWKDEKIGRRIVTDDFLQSNAAYQFKMVDYFSVLDPPVPGDFAALAEGMTVYREGRREKVEELTAEVVPKLLLVKEKVTVGDPLDFLSRDGAKEKKRVRSRPAPIDSFGLFPPSSYVLEDRMLSEASLWNAEGEANAMSGETLERSRRSRRLEDPDFLRLFSSSPDDFLGFLHEVSS
ncbi:hypothetical protein RvY_11202 [Ramazzottius varieornatus]|uniref:Uncharacterized protein n=1 Tax=Ramazzottius varieornatus TaxID=947166 RepID=A0A1D1VHR5_RAMVA|nr:hypothetical protein RvY_11202 [Ramazzottius varieornatus]